MVEGLRKLWLLAAPLVASELAGQLGFGAGPGLQRHGKTGSLQCYFSVICVSSWKRFGFFFLPENVYSRQ